MHNNSKPEYLEVLCSTAGIFQKIITPYFLNFFFSFLTLTVHSPTKSNKGKWRKCAKSDYVIEAGFIWERNRWPGSDSRVACHGWTVHCGAGAPVRNPGGTPIFWPLPFRGDRLETKKGARELGLTMHNTSYTLTLTAHSPTKSNKGKWRKCAKSDYVIEAGLIWERNRWPGSDSRVACHGWTVHCGAGGAPVRNPGGTPIFWPLPFRGDRLETKKGARELGLIQV